jgi:hypothetical protein
MNLVRIFRFPASISRHSYQRFGRDAMATVRYGMPKD